MNTTATADQIRTRLIRDLANALIRVREGHDPLAVATGTNGTPGVYRDEFDGWTAWADGPDGEPIAVFESDVTAETNKALAVTRARRTTEAQRAITDEGLSPAGHHYLLGWLVAEFPDAVHAALCEMRDRFTEDPEKYGRWYRNGGAD